MNKKTNLEVKVLAINTLYEYAQKFYEYEKKHFSQFIGKDIFKVDGSIKAKYEHERLSFKGQLPDGTWYNAHYWFESKYSFDIHVKICVNGGSYDVKPTTAFCQYEEISIKLFDIKDGSLIETESAPDFLNKRYEVSELIQQANEIKELAKRYEYEADKFPYIFKQVCDIQRLQRY